jgi:DNA-directed RNA polymerase subunit RPC12/RpoP
MNSFWEEMTRDSGLLGTNNGRVNWPPIMCPKCWAMRFLANERMAQCLYCGYLVMNWGRHASV